MLKTLLRLMTPTIESQVREELFIAKRELLEADGVLENAQSRVVMLQRRVSRLSLLAEQAEREKKIEAARTVSTEELYAQQRAMS